MDLDRHLSGRNGDRRTLRSCSDIRDGRGVYPLTSSASFDLTRVGSGAANHPTRHYQF
jgi:hypothetical protein